ncbi:MAG: hypothetical protein J1E63_03105 [Muribaculaceae bacterium]|nr:hypothetical protein [Muribaculaceae bacterium]
MNHKNLKALGPEIFFDGSQTVDFGWLQEIEVQELIVNGRGWSSLSRARANKSAPVPIEEQALIYLLYEVLLPPVRERKGVQSVISVFLGSA